jgi:uncharacterized protein YbaA (DUF1428 family)
MSMDLCCRFPKNLDAYWKMAQDAGNVWKEYGALEFVECAADDKARQSASFPRASSSRMTDRGFSYIVYESVRNAIVSTSRS